MAQPSPAGPAPAGPAPARGRRVRRPSGDDRERDILATAERLLRERSLQDISVDDLARGAGISRPTFYFYFPSKEAVVLALLDRVVAQARARRDDVLEGVPEDPEQRWRRALTAVRDTFRAHPGLNAAAAELIACNAEVRALWSRVMEGFVDDAAAVIEAERARGAAPGGPPARDLAVALTWMNERVMGTSFAGQQPALDQDDLLDVLLTVWVRAVYGGQRPV